ncbi:two-component regulator propeller domain-containing protein [Niabella sp. CJ426]|uniref:hybrid sensor histidine kinase/response regulator transcription factor n=1 Tax=Niabella sp. CJ426 TaxID=3393740 RepID=UPI003D062E8C
MRYTRNRYFFIIVLSIGIIAACIEANGQNPSFNSWNTEAGLSHNSVFSIAQDKSGFIWAAAGNTLNRFDGKEIRMFGPHKPGNPATENDINTLLIDKSNRMWIGMSRGFLTYDIQKNRFDSVRLNTSDAGLYVFCLFEDEDGNIWAGTSRGIFRLKDREKFRFEKFGEKGSTKIEQESIRCLFVDKSKTIWVGTNAGLTAIKSTAQGLQYQHFKHDSLNASSLSSNIITAIYADKYDNLWIGTQSQGINLFRKHTNSFIRINTASPQLRLNNNIIRVIRPDGNGNIWIGTQEGLTRLNWTQQTITTYKNDPGAPHSLSQNSVHSIYIDRNQLVWIGTFFGGMNVINPFPSEFTIWQNNGNATGLSNNVVSSVASDKEGNLWIGTEGGGLNQYRKNSGDFTYYTHGSNAVASNLIKSVYRDRNGNIWVGTHAGGLTLYANGTFKRYFYTPDNPNFLRSEISTIAEDHNNNLWIGLQGGLRGVQVYERSGTTLNDIGAAYNWAALKGKNVKKIFPDSENNIWIGTSSGLYLIKAGKKIVTAANRFIGQNDTAALYITCIQEDHQGNMWFGVEDGGFKKYDRRLQQLYTFTFSQQIKRNNIYGILEDSNGFIWLSTGNGLVKLNPITRKFQRYTQTDGLPSNTFNYNAYFKDDNGTFYFGGYSGLVSFDPASFKPNTIKAPILFTGLKTLNHPGTEDITAATELELKYNQNVFTIDFALLNYLKPEKNKYVYQLKGFDDQWIGTDRPSVTYMNLKPGHYRLAVKGANNDGIWSDEKELSIIVLPPFWRTWWAYLIYFLVCSAILFLIIRFFYLRELIQKEEALHQSKLDFFTNVTHEIRTHLTLIMSPVDKMISDRASDSYLQQQFQHIKKNANNLLRLSEELMDFRKAETENMRLQVAPHDIVAFIKEIYEHFTEISLARNMHISLTHNIQHQTLYFDAEQLEKVFFNLISNAFKFTPDGGKIQVHIEDVQHYVKISVSDNGRGIAPEYKDKLFNNFFQVNDSGSQNKGYGIGLALSSKIAALHGARIEVDSELSANESNERRTTFSVFLQKGSDHFNQQMSIPAPYVTLDKTVSGVAVSESHEALSSTPVSERIGTNQSKFTILVVDDNPGIRQTVQEILEQTHTVILKSNVAEGWSYASEQLPDIIISDVMMPGEDGLSFCNKLKSDIRTCHIPVILLTAKSTQQDHIEGLYKGADLYLTKPFNRTVLDLSVGNLLNTSERLRQNVEHHIQKGLLSTATTNNSAEPAPLTNPLDDEFLNDVLHIIESNLDEPDFNVASLAQKVAMSVPVLYKKMKAVTNLSVNDFIKSVKLQKAAQLLSNTNMAVYEVCYAVGFQDRKHFSTEFKKKFGTSPKQYAMSVRNSHPPGDTATGPQED